MTARHWGAPSAPPPPQPPQPPQPPISRAVVNHEDGTGSAIDPLVWSAGSAPKRRRVAVRNRGFFTWTA